ncbi:hypothetical protein MBM_03916 [Drepanopeziza brunnea f. sp. 'multigermtubi' MB_m1]|uniref:Uncharacterized protein n=1 Tax=Marssonina brunnea f. sp. multigermtubi (strain MB_m1) TaxID=1072389 RepID=K1XZD7_MARBU|nr:uncharacterized protein MBM_03916 [Drepanopeziza brunnea f. sp. 'multigermtubi' MB_m1]EKD18144.1 hypothetical protein MBM_03916 [Drepanopeziza brunnea f. sp. 'multigermtubi' MB_m1]
MLRSKSIFTILLTLSFLSEKAKAQGFWWWRQPTEQIIIGYAQLPEEQAKRINQSNKLYVDESPYLNRLGLGFYLINDPRVWLGKEGGWYCAIKANESKMRNIEKVYIPKSYEQKIWNRVEQVNLWGGTEEVIVDYIEFESKPKILQPEKALRFSLNWQMQMLIPTKVVDNGDLDLWGKCFRSENELKQFSYNIIDWESWNIKGDRGKPVYDPVFRFGKGGEVTWW